MIVVFHESWLNGQITNAHLCNKDIITVICSASVLPSIMMHLCYQASRCNCVTKHHDASDLPSISDTKHDDAPLLPSIMMRLFYQAWCIWVTKHHDASGSSSMVMYSGNDQITSIPIYNKTHYGQLKREENLHPMALMCIRTNTNYDEISLKQI